MANNNPPRRIDIKGQDHMLAYITPEEGGILQLLGGSGAPGPMGIPSFYGPDGPGNDGTDPSDTSVDDVGTEEDPGPSFSGVNVGGGYNSNTISNAMAASSPTGIGVGFGGRGGSTNMGIDDDISAMMGINAGVSRGMIGKDIEDFNKRSMIDPMTGKRSAFNPSFGKIAYDPFNNLRNKVNQHVGNQMALGLNPNIAMNHIGQVTGTRGPGGTSGMPFGLVGLAAMALNNMGVSTQTGYGFADDDDDSYSNAGEQDDTLLQTTGQPYQMPTNPYEDEDPVIGKSLPINRNEPYETTQQSPLLNAQEIQDQFGLSQGLDYTRNPFAGMSIQDQQTLGSDKEVMGIASLNPLEAEDIFANVSEENMAGQRFMDSSEDIEDIAQRVRGLS